MKDKKYVDEKAREAHKRFAFSHYDSHGTWIKEMKDFIRTIREDCKVKASKKWVGKFTHDVFVFDPSEKYTFYDFLRDKLKEVGVEVEE